jgi:hypothetical protein
MTRPVVARGRIARPRVTLAGAITSLRVAYGSICTRADAVSILHPIGALPVVVGSITRVADAVLCRIVDGVADRCRLELNPRGGAATPCGEQERQERSEGDEMSTHHHRDHAPGQILAP